MSLEPTESDDDLERQDAGVTADGRNYDAIETLLDDAVLDRETHENAEGFVIPPDDVQDVLRSPCFSNLQALPEMARGEYVPDLVATLGSLDTIMGEVDR